MRENEFKALISLLEDDDPGVGSHVEDTLLAMGNAVIPRLEAAWELEVNETVQSRIEDIIQTIQVKQTEDELSEWKSSPHTPLLQGWYLITKYQFPEISFETYYNSVNRLIHKAWLEHTPHMNIPEKISVINRMLYHRERYKFNRSTPLDPNNYFLNNLLESKKGGAISLGMLHMIVSRELKIPLEGIPILGHFILVYRDKRNEFFLDPINKGAFFSRKDLEKYLLEMKIPRENMYFEPVSNVEIVTKLVEMLLNCYRNKKKKNEAALQKWEALQHKLKYE